MQNPFKNWHSRGYLPHFDGEGAFQFVTFRLFDSMPANLLKKWRIELDQDRIEKSDIEFRKRIELYLDQGHGNSYLRDPGIADLIQNSLLILDGKKIKLISWVIMPNHVHILIKVMSHASLSEVMKTLKGYTAHEANKLLGRRGKFWQEDYFDRYIRDENHYISTVRYIENNPVKANLCKNAADWLYGSACLKNQFNNLSYKQ
jgi:putative DNA methylase